MLVVVAYDVIEDNKRRTQLRKALKRFGVHVQRSVVECWLGPREILLMKQAVFEIVRERIDEVKFYYFCEQCQRRIEATFASKISSDPPTIIV